MSNEQLVAEIQAGAVERMGELWDQVERLAKWKANHIMTVLEGCPGRGVEFEDLYQTGYLAMVKAAETYSPAAGSAFSTWFMYHLKTAFAEATGYRTQKGRKDPLNNSLSLDTPLTDDADSDDLMDVVADPAGLQWQESLEESMWRKELQEAMETALSTLPEQYREILRLRYWENMTLTEVGDLRGVGYERVRQMENKAIRQLQKPGVACHLRPFLDFDFYCGTGLGAFLYGGMSVQERYLMIEEERKERAERRRREQEEQERQHRVQREKELAESRERYEQWLAEYLQSLSPEDRAEFDRRLAEMRGK